MSSSGYGFVDVAFHQSEGFETLCHETTHGEVHIEIAHSGFCDLQSEIVTIDYDVVDVALTLCVFSCDGSGAGVVRTVVFASFTSCIYQK